MVQDGYDTEEIGLNEESGKNLSYAVSIRDYLLTNGTALRQLQVGTALAVLESFLEEIAPYGAPELGEITYECMNGKRLRDQTPHTERFSDPEQVYSYAGKNNHRFNRFTAPVYLNKIPIFVADFDNHGKLTITANNPTDNPLCEADLDHIWSEICSEEVLGNISASFMQKD